MFCPRCGEKMDPNRRYCMKCGALNYEHPENQKMKKYITEAELAKAKDDYNNNVDTIQVAGEVIKTKKDDKRKSYVDTKSVFGLLFLMAILLGCLCYFGFNYSISLSLVVAIVYFLITFFVLSGICIYMKGGYSGFVPLIPFYSQYAYCDIALGNGWLFLLTLIPIFGLFYAFYINYRLGKVFGKNGILTMLFPIIMIPIISFSDSANYEGEGKKYQDYVKKEKRRNTKFAALVYSVLIFGFLFLVLNSSIGDSLAEFFLERDVQKVVDTVKKDIYDGIYVCDQSDINNDDGTYYIAFDDATKVMDGFLPVRSSVNGKQIRGYVVVEHKGRKNMYSYVMTDEKNVLSSSSSSITPSEVKVPEGVILCKKS